MIHFQTYPDIFFSMRNLTNINVLKLISKGKFKKVTFMSIKALFFKKNYEINSFDPKKANV